MINSYHSLLLIAVLAISGRICELPYLKGLTWLYPSTSSASLTRQANSSTEPLIITGDIKYTSPFFVDSLAEPFVLLEDEAGFVTRDKEFIFEVKSQTMGPVELVEDGLLSYNLSLPSKPQGTFVDVDNNGQKDSGVQVFAVAYWSNTWGSPFLEPRDGRGWSTEYTSATIDPENDNEIIGGTLLVWAPDDKQKFPSEMGPDGLLFTKDDPVTSISAGYNLVDLDKKPFRIYKEAEPKIDLKEGASAVKDYSDKSYMDAFDTMFKRIEVEYPFTKEKKIDWEALRKKFYPLMEQAKDDTEFYNTLHDFLITFPDGHVGGAFSSTAFFEAYGGGFGINLAKLSNGKVIFSKVLDGLPAQKAGIQSGAELISWNGKPVQKALEETVSYFGPGSTKATRLDGQLTFLPRLAPMATAKIAYKNPGGVQAEQTITSSAEYDSLLLALYGPKNDALSLPVEAETLDSGILYVRVNSFSDDYNLSARLWERYIKQAIKDESPSMILDLRNNGGGSLGLAMDLAGFFFDKELTLYRRSYYSEKTGKFEYQDTPTKIRPAPQYYSGKVAVLISPNCVSACEGFAYALAQENRSTIIGYDTTAGAFGEVGRGQYKLPGDLEIQFPTGRPETMDGSKLVIENTGVIPNVLVPLTLESALGKDDALLAAAVKELSK